MDLSQYRTLIYACVFVISIFIANKINGDNPKGKNFWIIVAIVSLCIGAFVHYLIKSVFKIEFMTSIVDTVTITIEPTKSEQFMIDSLQKALTEKKGIDEQPPELKYLFQIRHNHTPIKASNGKLFQMSSEKKNVSLFKKHEFSEYLYELPSDFTFAADIKQSSISNGLLEIDIFTHKEVYDEYSITTPTLISYDLTDDKHETRGVHIASVTIQMT